MSAFDFVALAKNATRPEGTRPGLYDHWKANPAEVKGWSKQAAELLAIIPAPVAAAAINTSAALTVAVGLGMMVYARVQVDRLIATSIAHHQRPPAPAPATGEPRGNTNGQRAESEAINAVGVVPDLPVTF